VPQPDPHRRTVVAFYGPKREPLAGLLAAVQEQVGRALGGAYRPRPTDEVHATVIGLDRPTRADPDLPGLLADLARAFTDEPLTLQFGGFRADDRRLPSRGRTPAQRTLTVQGGRVVLIGLPVGPGADPAPLPRLGEVRRQGEARGFRHKYHEPGGPLDPDAYLALGELTGPVRPGPPPDAAAVAALARATRVELGRADLALVEYRDPALPRATSRWWPV
jgi:hypothetical protein